MKTHHSTDAHSRGLSKAVQNCVIYNYFLEQMQCFRTKISIAVAQLTHGVTSASKLSIAFLAYTKRPQDIV